MAFGRRPDDKERDTDTLVLRQGEQKRPLTESFAPAKKPVLARDWLSQLTTEQLIEASYQISAELKARIERSRPTPSGLDDSTEKVSQSTPPSDFKSEVDAAQLEYQAMPAQGSTRSPAEAADTTWRIVLFSANPNHEPLALKINDDIVVGRDTPEAPTAKMDLSLAEYDGEAHGVSRRHAVLRPRASQLLIYDLDSTNGTLVNGNPLTPHRGHPVADGDRLSFGALHFKLRVISQPAAGVKASSV